MECMPPDEYRSFIEAQRVERSWPEMWGPDEIRSLRLRRGEVRAVCQHVVGGCRMRRAGWGRDDRGRVRPAVRNSAS